MPERAHRMAEGKTRRTAGRLDKEPVPFAGPAAFRAWLAKNHATASELYVRCRKVGAGSGLTYREALDEALCIGWIDGVRRAFDASTFSQRFSPRKSKSAWSTVNIRRYQELEAEGRVLPPGRKAFEARVKSRYSFESRPRELSPGLLRLFKANAKAWAFFAAQAPYYQRTCSFWVMSGKQEETRQRRLSRLIALSARGQGPAPLKVRKLALEKKSRGPR
jgi:uncharacterized protein YdeI (YjbR/CyaY-like superfamily)